QAVDMLVNVDQKMSYIVADNVGVNRPEGTNVPISTSYPSLSIASSPRYAYTQKVGVLISDGFHDEEVIKMLEVLHKYGVFVEIVSEKLGVVTGANGTDIEVDKTFLSTRPYLFNSLHCVGWNTEHHTKINPDMLYLTNVAYTHYKPIGVDTNAQSYRKTSKANNLYGVVFASNNLNLEKEFIEAKTTQ